MYKTVNAKWMGPYFLLGMTRDAVYVFVLSFFFVYLYKVLALPISYILPAFIIVKLVDIIKEPFIGMLIDVCAYVLRFNKFRITPLIGGIINATVLIQMFDVPMMDTTLQTIYATFMLCAWSLSFSLIDLPSWAITSVFGSDHKSREIIAAIARISALCGFCLCSLATFFVFSDRTGAPAHIQNAFLDENLFRKAAWYIAGSTFITAVLFGISYNGNTSQRKVSAPREAPFHFFGNDQLMVIFFITVLQQICICVFVAYQNFYAITLRKIPSDEMIHLYINIPWVLTCLLSCLSFHPLVRLLSRKKVFYLSAIIPIAGFISLYLLHNLNVLNLALLSAIMCIISFGFGLSMTSTTVMTADSVDYGEFKFGKRSECMNFSVQICASKMGSFVSFIVASQSSAYASFLTDNRLVSTSVYSINLSMVIVCICAILMIVVYSQYYKLHESFFENILNALNNFGKTDRPFVKKTANSVRYALDEQTVIYNIKGQTLDEILKVLTDRLYTVKAISSKREFLNALHEKIKQNPAGIAHGIAISHARGSFVKRSALAVATVATPIDCGSYDNVPCDLFFLIAVPDDGKSHINLLGNLSLMLSEPGFADKLRHSGSSEEIARRLIACEKKMFKF